MESSDQSFNFAVELIGVSASSPDPARWLVVPLENSDELTIEDMTYYHAGDIIVAAGGTLTLRNAVLQLVQSEPYERTIYVDGSASSNGTLLVEDSMITSDFPMNLVVQGYGTLVLKNAVVHGVNIVAKEHAQVIMLDNSSVDGMLSTTWDSSAQVILRDTSLVQTPVLAGNSVGGFTNSSLPSIAVEDSAVADIYRWIHVTVYDGAGFPLPNATVTIRYFVNETFAGSALSSYLPGQLGVAKVNSLGTRLTSSGSTFFGNYRVNVSYSFAGVDYFGEEIAVGVMPYTEPLEKNATYAVITIEEALPDVSVGEITVSPTDPVKGEATTVNARINNEGIVGAYNVVVDFYDDDDNEAGIPTADEWFATVVVPWIGPGGFAVASTIWTADPILDPYSHRLVAIVDPNNTIPELGEPPVVTQMGEGYITVQSLADLEVRSGTSEIWASTSIVIVNVPVQLNANIHNIGDAVASPVRVNFYDSVTLIGFVNVSVNPGEYTTASITHTFTTAVSHTLWVRANENMAITELSYGNNNNTATIVVRPPPDLNLRDMTTTPTGAVSGGNPLNVTAMLENLQLAPIANPVVKLYANYSDLGVSYSNEYTKTIPATLALGDSPIEVWFLFTVPILSETSTMDLTMIVNHARTQTEASYANNMQSLQVAVLDIRPDLAISGADIRVYRGTGEVQSETFGRTLTIVAEVVNLGGRDANTSVMIGVRTTGYNHTILEETNYYDVNASSSTNVSVAWTVGLTTPGTYELWVWVDSQHGISEPDDSNNFAERNFTITQLQVTVTVSPDKTEHDAGDLMVVAVQVMYAGTGDPVKFLPNITAVLWLGEDEITLSRSNATSTDSTGIANAFIRIPADLNSGQYTVIAEILGVTYESDTTVHISAQVAGGLFPWWVWVLIIVIIVGVVAGFTVYTYVYGLGKLVECGECGAFIPAASKRCPKCGVEFEAGTMKCSECGAWIPAESAECPNCGVKFVGETEEEADYLERMKTEYDEMVSKYRELARPELGKKFSEKQFEEWWRKQPAYISFDDWLAKEEEKKKEGPVPCPVCGTLNPKEATVCHKCGTVFAPTKEVQPGERRGPPPAAPPSVERPVEAAPPSEQLPPAAAPVAAAPRMVIRRPIEKKVVPKKIIKTPLSGEEKEGEGNEEQ